MGGLAMSLLMSLLEIALQLIREGIPIFPLLPGKKRPIYPGGFHNATCDEEQVREWWKKHPNANIGVPTGRASGITVVDVDGPVGVESIRNAIGSLPETRVHMTPHGTHNLYQFDESFHEQNGILPKVDIKSDKGYLVWAGSIVDCDKPEFHTSPTDHKPVYWVVRDIPPESIGDVPEVFRKRDKPKPTELSGTKTTDRDWVGEDLLGVEKGRRDERACALFGKFHHDGYSRAAILTILQGYAANCSPPWVPGEDGEMTLEEKVDYWRDKYPREPDNLTSHHIDLQWEVNPLERVNAAVLQEEGGLLNLPFLPLLEQSNFIVMGWSHLIAASPKVGKTELLVQLCREWSGEEITYFTEEPRSIWQARLSQYPKGCLDHVTLVFALGCNPNDIIADIREGPGSVVVIDTIRNLIGLTEENDNSHIAKKLIPYVVAARKTNKTSIFIHHSRKGGGEYGEAIAGGHAFLGTVDVALELHRVHGVDLRRKVTGLGRIILIPDLIYERNAEGFMVALGDPAQVTREAVKENILAEGVLSGEWQKIKDIQPLLDEPRPGLEQLRLALKDLAANEKVERHPAFSEGDKRGATYYWRARPDLTSHDPPKGLEVRSLPPKRDEEVMEFPEEAVIL